MVPLLLLLAAAAGTWWYSQQTPPEPQHSSKPPPVEIIAEPAPTLAAPAVPAIEPKAEPVAKPVEEAKPTVNTAAMTLEVPVPPPVKEEDHAFDEPLKLDGVAARATAEVERAASLLRRTLEKGEWSKYLPLLDKSIAAELAKSPDFSTPQRYERYTSNPIFMRALLQHVLGEALGDEVRSAITKDERLRQHMTWLCENPDAMESFLRARTSRNNLRQSLEAWTQLASDDPEALGAYRELAIACSLVLERPKSYDWSGDDVTLTAEERYRWFKEKDKAGLLVGKVRQMTAWELAWVVGVPVPEKEMEWAVAEMRRRAKQKDWGRTYGMVRYAMEKVLTGKLKEPYEYYTFAEILKKGGICGDQAYFSANTARCVGIPAVVITGDGPRGPHAWVAWLADEGKWQFSGRFGGYPAGSVSDPRSGEKLSEQCFTRLSSSNAPSQATMIKAQRFLWLHDFQARTGDKAGAEQALNFALSISPHQADLWEKKISVWSAQQPPLPPATWKPFIDALKREFRDDSDMLATARKVEDQYVLAKVDVATARKELQSDVRDLTKLKGLTSLEEIRTSHARYASAFIDTKDFASVRRVYREALDDYGREAAKFKALADDYWNHMQAAPPEMRMTVCRDLDAAYLRHVQKRSGDHFDVESQNSAAKVVADYWRQVGNAAKADRIEKEMEKRAIRARRDSE